MNNEYGKNYFPNYQCGECSKWLGMDDYLEKYTNISNLDTFIENLCKDCDLFKKGIKVINKEYSMYKNCFIQKVQKEECRGIYVYMYKVVNRNKLFYDILEACEYIDRLIKED